MTLLDRMATARFARSCAGVLLGLVAARTLWLLAEAWPYDTDDAFITLRYAQNWAAGHGIVWNVGDPPVEGYSNFLSLVLARAALAVGLDPLVALKAIGGLALGATGALVYRLGRRYLGPLGATAPVFLLTAHPGQILWAVTGLETSLYALGVVATVFALARALRAPVVADGDHGAATEPEAGPAADLDGRWLYAAGGLAFATSLARAEGPLVAIAIGLPLLGHLVARRRPRDLGRAVVVLAMTFAVPYAIYFAWRWAYFERPLPNSVYCKAGFDDDPYFLVRSFWQDAGSLVLLSLIVPWRRMTGHHAASLLLTALYVGIMIGAYPVLGFWIRYFLPVRALLVVTCCAGLFNVVRVVLPGMRGPHREVVLAMAVVLWTGSLVEDVLEPIRARIDLYQARTGTRVALAEHLRSEMRADDWYVIGDAGLVPYLTGGYVLDAFCLNNPAMTRPPIERSTTLFVEDMFARRPPFIAVHSARGDRLVARTEHGAVFPEIVRHPDLRAHYELDRVFGDPKDDFHYWVFRRRVSAGP